MTQFNWQTEEDIVWEELPAPEPPAPPPNRRRRLQVAGLLLGLFVVVGLVVYWQVRQRVEAGMQTVREDVLSSYNLTQRAAADQDVDLLTSLMSGRNMGWVEETTALVEAGTFFDRQPFKLNATTPFMPETAVSETEAAAAENSARIVLSPDLTEAEVSVVQPYTYQLAPDESETVFLEQTAVYRLGSSRWLFSPPDAAFWGDLQTIENDRLTVRFRAREQEIVERLAADLTEQFEQACQLIQDLDCASGLFVQLHFEPAPNTLSMRQSNWEPVAGVDNGWRLSLPTPTLVGLPIDDRGYEALLHGYARELITAVMLHQANWECCRGQPFATALVNYELSRLQLQRWPVTAASYDKVLAEAISLDALTTFYIGPSPDAMPPIPWSDIYAAVDFFIQTNPAHSPMQMLQDLQQDTLFGQWLQRIIHDEQSVNLTEVGRYLTIAWHLFAETQKTGALQTAPIAYPAQDLYQMCVTSDNFNDISQSNVRRLTLGADEWESILEVPDFGLVVPIDNDKFVVQQFGSANNVPRTSLWQNGRLTPLNSADGSVNFTLGQTDPTNSHLLLYSSTGEQLEPEPTRLDLKGCQADDCPQQPLPGVPAWSPNGRLGLFVDQDPFQFAGLMEQHRVLLFDASTIVSQPDAPILLGQADGQPLADGTNLPQVGHGISPFWLDDETYGYFRLPAEATPSNQRELVLATLDDPTPQPLLNHEDLAGTLSNSRIATQLQLAYALPNPVDSNSFYLTGFDEANRDAYVWSFDFRTNGVALLASANYAFWHSMSVSPNGRFLLLNGSSVDNISDTEASTMLLLDLNTNETRRYTIPWPLFAPIANFAWSEDGQWLAFAISPGQVGLLALESNYLELIPASEGNCISVGWFDSQ